MERNRELFEKIAAQIEETPHLWNQDVFADETECGTAMCVAGWATFLTCGLKADPNDPEFYQPANGEHFGDHARKVLGLTDDEGSDLFYGDWDRNINNNPGDAAEFLRAIGSGAEFNHEGLVGEAS